MRHENKKLLPIIITDPSKIADTSLATLDRLDLPELAERGIQADVLRLDKIHPVISGNKWFKVKYYLQKALQNQHIAILTFGGPYSNHIVAAARAAREAGLGSIGIIRGERPETLSHTLQNALDDGMRLQFISREEYRRKTDAFFLSRILGENPGTCLVPEGGAGPEGIRGCEEILQLVDKEKYTHILCAAGTATLLRGLINASGPRQEIIGISVLKGFSELPPDCGEGHLPAEKVSNGRLIADYHFGGYARRSGPLFAFMNKWYGLTGIPTDFVYTAKLFYAAFDLVKTGYFPQGSRLLLIHSGGLQGNLSLEPGILSF
ncbi:MAG: 1-aminocyclopropane-1-carboxylate deaminase [Puia sp.]|nr:1-aminocyclopropane-1-carboxylate deaminase [Puia sp.]